MRDEDEEQSCVRKWHRKKRVIARNKRFVITFLFISFERLEH